MKIEDLLRYLAEQPAPGCTADAVYKAGLRRRRRTRHAQTLLLTASLLLLTGAVTAGAQTLRAGLFAPAGEEHPSLAAGSHTPTLSPPAVPSPTPPSLPLPTGLADVPSIPPVTCADARAKALDALGAEGYSVAGTTDVTCEGGVLTIRVTAATGSVNVYITVTVRLDDPGTAFAQVCTGQGSCSPTPLPLR